MQRYVTLGDGRHVGLGTYVQAWRNVLVAPSGASFNRSLSDSWSSDRETILRQFRDGLHNRINRHIPTYGRGRKWDSQWQRDTRNAARQLNSNVRFYWLPQWLKSRFAHRIASYDD